jgi:signal peptidase I
MAENKESTQPESPTIETQIESFHPTTKNVSLAEAFGGQSLLREIVETLLLTLLIFLLINALTGRFQVRGSSMEPTLQDGQYLVISKLSYWIHPPERGDVVVFRPPGNRKEDYIKRIIGLPGDKIEIRDEEIRVNGALLKEPYITDAVSYAGSWTLAEDSYFVLGDNRRNSSDSHTWGPLPSENIVGKAWLCYWPPQAWGLVAHHTFPELTYTNRTQDR